MRRQDRLQTIGALATIAALFLAIARGFRRRGLRRAVLAATAAGLAVAAFSVALLLPRLRASEGEWLPFLRLAAWFVFTHGAMALAEGAAASAVLARLRRRPSRALRGAVLGAFGVHLGGILFVLAAILRQLGGALDAPFELFLVLFAPFAPAGALLASLGTFYGDVARAEPQAAPTDIPG